MRMRAMEPDFVHDIEIPSHLAAYLDQSPSPWRSPTREATIP